MQNTNTDQNQRGLRMLSLDDGGVRGLSELLILRVIMDRLMYLENLKTLPKPCDYFDIIGGAGTGGVIALMLGRLRMPIDLAIEMYVLLSKEISSNVKKRSIWGEKSKVSVFESCMQLAIQAAGFPEDVLMQEDHPLCKSFVVALPSVNMTPRIFRTYEVTANQGYNCSVMEAACATTATPGFLKHVSISSGGISETFVGARLGYSNPTDLVVEEAVLVFGLSQAVACLVSIGAGHPGHVSLEPNYSSGQELMKLLHQIATDCEDIAEGFKKRCLQKPGLFYRLNVDQGLQRIAFDDWNEYGKIKTHTHVYVQNTKVGEELKNLVISLDGCPQITTLELLSGTLPASSTIFLPAVPAPSSLFSGRADILLCLEKCFISYQSSSNVKEQKICVLYGLGGAGKTQIALQFCHQFRSKFSSIYMINASYKASIEQFLTQLAQSAKLTETTSTAALTWLCYQREEWLMIFDDADDADVNLQDFFPGCSHGNILITSRNDASKLYAHENHYKIGEMSLEDSLAVFYKASHREKDEHEAAKELVQELGYLALAIVQSGSYLLRNQHIEVKQYLKSYRKDMSRYLAETKKQKMDKYSLSVFATWNLSYQKLDEKAKGILMLCGVLHNSKIPVSILERAWRNLPTACEVDMQELHHLLGKFVIDNKDWSDELVENALDMLTSYSLVEIRGRGVVFLEIHSLVHKWALKSLSREQQEKAKQCAQQLFCCLGDEGLEYNDATQWVLHVQTLMNHLNYRCENDKMAKRLGRIFFAACFWSNAEQLQQQVLEECEKILEHNHVNTIEARADLATTFRKGGKLHKAEKLEQEVLKVREEACGRNHPNTILAMSHLATTFWKGGRLEEAEKLQKEVLKLREEALGCRHPDTILAMVDLALTISDSGKLEEAEKIQQQVLKIKREDSGSNHPDTILAMSNLAITFWKGGKLKKAEKLAQEVLEAKRQDLGSNHPDTVVAMSNLAAIFWKDGKLEDAEELQQEVLEVNRKAFGNYHPDTILVMNNLAVIMSDSGRLLDAEKLQQEVLKVRREVFGNSHTDTILAMSNLATTFWKSGKLEEAEKLQEEVVKVRREAFGDNHPKTILAMSDLAVTISDSGRLEEAEKIQQEVLKIKKETYGSTHPDTTLAMSNLATTLWKGERLEEAEKLEKEVLKIKKEAFGDSHPDTISAMSNLVTIFLKSGKWKEAEELIQEVLKCKREAFTSRSSHLDVKQSFSY